MAAAAAFLVLTGVVGVGRGGQDLHAGHLLDYTIVAAAGRALLEGANAYVPAEFAPFMLRLAPGVDPTSPFSYPPHLTTLMAAFAALPPAWGRGAWVVLLLACVGISAWVVRDLGAGDARDPARGPVVTPWLFAALFVANPVTSHDLWLGQPALLAASGLLLVLAGRLRKRRALTVVGLVLAAIKPQLSLLVFFYLALDGGWREIGIAALVGLALSLPAIFTLGPGRLVASYIARLETHEGWVANLPGSESSIGIRSFFWALGIHVPGLEIVGLALTALLWRARDRVPLEDRFGLLVGLTLLFLFNQDSAYVLIVPVIAAVARHASGRRRLPWVLVALGVVFSQPRRLVRHAGHPALSQWRTLVVAALVALLVLALRADEKGEPLMPSFGRRPKA